MSFHFTGSANVLTVTNTNDTGIGSLREAVQNSVASDTIRFAPFLLSGGSVVLLLDSEIVVQHPLSVVGLYTASDTLYISGQNASRIFHFDLSIYAGTSSKSVYLDSLCLLNGLALSFDDGGALLIESADSVYMHNSLIRGSTATGKGGGAFIESADSVLLRISGSSMIGNHSNDDGGGIACQAISSDVKIDNTVFSGNTAQGTGGGLYVGHHLLGATAVRLEADHCIFQNNDSGGLRIDALNSSGNPFSTQIKLSNSILDSNVNAFFVSLNPSDTAVVEILDCSFSGNVDGAILIGGNAYTVISNTTTTGNLGRGVSQSNGFLNIENCTLTGHVSNIGGAVYSDGIVQIENSIIDNNRSTGTGGGLHCRDLTLINSSVSDNFATGAGGGIFCLFLVVDDSCVIANDSAIGKGGGIYCEGSYSNTNRSIYISGGTTISDNYSGDDGGGVFVSDFSSIVDTINVYFDHVTLANNFALGFGGGLCTTADLENVQIGNCSVVDNQSDDGGGGFCNLGAGSWFVDSSSFTGNSSSVGAGIYSKDYSNELVVSECVFLNNASLSGGGAIEGKEVIILNCQIANNTAGGGGAVNGKVVTVKNSVISNNSAFSGEGGGVAANFVSIKNSTIHNNTAFGSGGGIYCRNGRLSMNQSSIVGNSSGVDGGGAACRNCDSIRIYETIIDSNQALGYGGGFNSIGSFLFQYDTLYFDIRNSKIRNNSGGDNGGGLCLQTYKSGTEYVSLMDNQIIRTEVSNNSAGADGGGIYIDAKALYFSTGTGLSYYVELKNRTRIFKSTINSNSADGNGGGIFCAASSGTNSPTCPATLENDFILERSTISGNSAQERGGGLYCFADRVRVNSPNNGSSISLTESEILNSTIFENSALLDGGGVYSMVEEGGTQTLSRIHLKGSIVAFNDSVNIMNDLFYLGNKTNTLLAQVYSDGWNVFSDFPMPVIDATDQAGISLSQLNLGALQNNGSTTETHLPGPGSVAMNNGDPNDNASAQNGPIIYVRDVGAAESNGCTQNKVFNIYNCGAYTWPVTGTIYNTSAMDSISGTNSQGCDSSAILNLVVLENVVLSDTITACGNYTWPVTSVQYFESGTYIDSQQKGNGCDSILMLHLTINDLSAGSDSVTTCGPFTWPANGMVYTTSGAYSATLVNAVGCDSIAALQLTVTGPSAAVYEDQNSRTLTAIEAGVSYQWLNCDSNFMALPGETSQSFTSDDSGSFAVVVSANGCVDTSDCYALSGIPLSAKEVMFSDVTLHPNPTSGFVTVDLGNSADVVVEVLVTSAAGQLVHSLNIHGQSRFEVSLDDQPSGIYFVVLMMQAGGTNMFMVSKL